MIAKDILLDKVKLHKEHLEKYEIDLNIKLILKKIEKAQNIEELMVLNHLLDTCIRHFVNTML